VGILGRSQRVCWLIVLIAIVNLAIFGATLEPPGNVLTEPLRVNPKFPPARPKGSCHIHGDLPDPECTPAVADAGVTQANIHQTICVPGYSKKIRGKYAPKYYTDALKKIQIRKVRFMGRRGVCHVHPT